MSSDLDRAASLDQGGGHGMGPVLSGLTERLAAARRFNVGFPGATDIDYRPLAELLSGQLLNNVGDPYVDGVAANHTKALEREVVELLADLLRAPVGDRWGYVTSGGSEGNVHGLHLARSVHPDGLVYVSEQAHYSMFKALELLAMPFLVIHAEDTGEMDYDDLAEQVDRNRHRPAIIAATAGTTLSEAVDDVRRIGRVLDAGAVRRRYLHVDAALSGIPLALLEASARPGFDFGDGADSITVSGHKFLGTPTPCGVVLTRASLRARLVRQVGYTGSPDATLLGSRNGHAALMLWYAVRSLGVDGLRARAAAARDLAAYTHAQIEAAGWETYRHPYAFTVVLRSPPVSVTRRWVLATSGGWSHVITMPGVTRDQIDGLLEDIRFAMAEQRAVSVVRQREPLPILTMAGTER